MPQVQHDTEIINQTRPLPTLAGAARASRRRLLAMVAALSATTGTAYLLTDEPAGARKGKDKNKNKNKRRKKKRKKGNGGGGGGGYSPDAKERAFLDLINDYRDQRGVRKLSLNSKLGAAAEFHSRDMAKKNYFKHKLSNGDSPEQNIRRFGYTTYTVVGENIAAGHQTANKIFELWRKSNGHNRNMLDPDFSEIGIGRAHKKQSTYGWYWTTTFGG